MCAASSRQLRARGGSTCRTGEGYLLLRGALQGGLLAAARELVTPLAAHHIEQFGGDGLLALFVILE